MAKCTSCGGKSKPVNTAQPVTRGAYNPKPFARTTSSFGTPAVKIRFGGKN